MQVASWVFASENGLPGLGGEPPRTPKHAALWLLRPIGARERSRHASMPRPASPNPRTAQLNLRFTPAEHAALATIAARHGLILSAWATRTLLAARTPTRNEGRPQPPAERITVLPKNILNELRAAGIRLNHAAHLINGTDNLVPPLLTAALGTLDALLTPLKNQLAPPAPPLDHASRHQIKKIAVNLTQIERRLDRQQIACPPLVTLWSTTLRLAVNNEVRPP